MQKLNKFCKALSQKNRSMSQKNINKKTRSKKRNKKPVLCGCNAHNMPHPKWVHQLRTVKTVWDDEQGKEVEVRVESDLWAKLQRSVPKRVYRTARRAFELGAFTTCKGVFERYGLWPAKKQKSKSRV